MKYSKEFKEEALKLSDEIGLKKAAQQLGIQYYTLSDWRSKRNAAAKAKKYQMTDDEAKQRITENPGLFTGIADLTVSQRPILKLKTKRI